MSDKASFNLKPAEASLIHPAAEQLAAKTGKKKQTRLNVMVDTDKQQEFKMTAMRQGKTMSEAINTFIDDFISDK
jgi:hypothetical protein